MSSRSNEPITITITSKLLDLNSYIRLERSPEKGYLIAASHKKGLTEAVAWETKSQMAGTRITSRCNFLFRWYAKNRRKDPDNIAFARKFIFDGFIEAGFMPDDNWRYVNGFRDEFYVDSEEPRVEITITPMS